MPITCSTAMRALASVLLPFALASASVAAPLLLRIIPPDDETPAAAAEVETTESEIETEEGSATEELAPSAAPPEGLSLVGRSPAFEVQTFAGSRPATSEQVDPQSQVVALVLVDTLLDDDWSRVESELKRLRRGLPRNTPLRLAAVSELGLQLRSGIRNDRGLAAALRDWRPAAPVENVDIAASNLSGAESPEPPPAALAEVVDIAATVAGTYDRIGAAAPVVGCEWNALLAIGRLPGLQSDLGMQAEAFLSHQMRTHRLRFSFLPLDGFVPTAADQASRSTGGVSVASVSQYLAYLREEAEFREVTWSVPPLEEGFHLYTAEVLNTVSREWRAVPSAAVAPSWLLPGPLQVKGFRQRVRALSSRASAGELTPAQFERLRTQIDSLQEINPRDEALLRTTAVVYAARQEWAPLADALAGLAEISPADPQVFMRLGLAAVRAEQWERAERALVRLRRMTPQDTRVHETLARVYLQREKPAIALKLLDEGVGIGPDHQALWFLRADAAHEVGKLDTTADSLEKGIALPNPPLQRRTELIRLYLSQEQVAQALPHLKAALEKLPESGEALATYAELSEAAGRPEESLGLWERASRADPEHVPAPVALARIHLELDQPDRSATAAREGIARFPQSAELHQALARALEAAQRPYDLRNALRNAVESLPDEESLLRQWARTEDLFGGQAPAAYRKLADRIAQQGGGDLSSVLERGFRAALRERDMELAAWFADEAADSRPEWRKLIRAAAPDEAATVDVLGGLRALAFFANANQTDSPTLFFQEHSRRVVAVSSSASKEVYAEFLRRMTLYFETVRDLSAFRDDRAEGGFAINLSAQDKRALRKTRRVLNLLGWKLRGNAKKGYEVVPVSSVAGTDRQAVASALEIEVLDLQDALARKEGYTLRVVSEPATVVLGESTWRQTLYADKILPGGFPEAVVQDPRIGSLYLGISRMHPAAAESLVASIGLKRLLNRYAEVLSMHGSALAVENGAVVVPGGADAEVSWTNLVGARPREPSAFFPALLKKDEGRLLGYFAALGNLDPARQQFLLHNAGRLRGFYELYKQAPEFSEGGRTKVRESPFSELLRELPLNADGTVAFPGGAEVWTVVRKDASARRLERRFRKAVAPEVEDQLLARLAKTKFPTRTGPRSQVDKFLALARMDLLRPEPMDAKTALYFAQAFVDYEEVFPYFATLTGLQVDHLQGFLAFARNLGPLEVVPRNRMLALFHGIAEILSVGQSRGLLDPSRAAELFQLASESLARAQGPGSSTDAALAVVDELVAEGSGDGSGAGADAIVRKLLLGAAASEQRREDYARVLDLQSVPTLETLLQARQASLGVALGEGDPQEALAALAAAIGAIPNVVVPKETKVEGDQKQVLASFDTRALLLAQRRLAKAAARKKPRQPELERLARRVREELAPHVAAALVGTVYGAYFRPGDLPVQDPLFLRKHAFYRLDTTFNDNFFPRSQLSVSSEGAGSFATGGFAKFASVAGHVAAFGLRTLDSDAEALARMQLGSLRVARWRDLHIRDMRRFALMVRLGREWIVAAALDENARAALLRRTGGILPVSRTQQLLGALDEHAWDAIWDSVSLADLHALGETCVEVSAELGMRGPVLEELLAERSGLEGESRLHSVGGVRPATFNYARPRRWKDGPYEEYERYYSADKIAERTAELSLYFLQAGDSLGVSVEQLAAFTETAARDVLAEVQMGDIWDWRSVLKTFAARARSALADALQGREEPAL